MKTSEIIAMSLGQSVEKLGDPSQKIFTLMYERFPDLLRYKEENTDWEDYMFQEIITNFMSLGDDPETALLTIRDMAAHHVLIGVPKEIFKGMYVAMFDVISETFYGPEKENMIAAWQSFLLQIHDSIERAA
ncbi:MAG: globin [Pseudomonadales bacterium]|nr:globin [Pseudomonadales bacterium]